MSTPYWKNQRARRRRPPDPMFRTFRRTIMPDDRYRALDEDHQLAVDVLALHCALRFRQRAHAPLETVAWVADSIFMTLNRIRYLLRLLDARWQGRHYARSTRDRMLALGIVEDTGETRKPRVTAERIDRAEKFQKEGEVAEQGGQGGQPSRFRSFWWPVYRVVALSTFILTSTEYPRPSWRDFDVPENARCLRSIVRRAGLIPRRRRRKRFEYGSVQAAFAATGPP